MAARCHGRPAATSPSPSRTTEDGPPPENPTYAENHAFKKQVPLDGAAQCRGRAAHADRIARARDTARGSAAPSARQMTGALVELGYPEENVQVSEWSGQVHFTVTVPETGPCVTGDIFVGKDIDVSPHGFYVEGGCVEPVGGH
ncbi:hypothetical protein ACIQ7Q_10355 [Streptomyces sp. NPDC096176]|uniref:hypothetical protein n=1 Tax=Streptomyces sp. NPDC096176 TaxID=3366079 RepID=UPI00382818D0